ncbi:MAG TPA: zeta toxin family protein [Terracidiphilus sp.]
MKEILILGGPNGAGKTTAARVLVGEFLGLKRFVNADELARGVDGASEAATALAAGRLMLERMRQLVRHGESFAFETTLSGKTYAHLLADCKAKGWRITLVYFWLSSPNLAVERVARRVSMGGHSIPTEVIKRRFHAGIVNLLGLYLPLADEGMIYDNTEHPRILIASKVNERPLVIHDSKRWTRLTEQGNEVS